MSVLEWITVLVMVSAVLAAAITLILGRATSDSHKKMPAPPGWRPGPGEE